jgi:hypothetical protein
MLLSCRVRTTATVRISGYGSPEFTNEVHTSDWRCCHGAGLRTAFTGRSMRDCPAFGQWRLDPANRAALDRSPSTISWELSRNRGAQVGYKPGYAHQQTRARRLAFNSVSANAQAAQFLLPFLRHSSAEFCPTELCASLGRACSGL